MGMETIRSRRGTASEASRAAVEETARAEGPEAARRRVLRLLEEQLRRIPPEQRRRPACAAGCDLCCHLRVMSTPVEVFGLLDYLERTLDQDAFDAFAGRVRSTAAALAALPSARVLTVNLPCPALVDGVCSGYAARPLNCRSYHSLDRTACEASFRAPEDLSLGHPQNAADARVHEGVQSGFVAGLGAAGYDQRQVELVTALAEALDDPGARIRFRDGGDAFLRPSPV